MDFFCFYYFDQEYFSLINFQDVINNELCGMITTNSYSMNFVMMEFNQNILLGILKIYIALN